MSPSIVILSNQVGLALGFVGAILLANSAKLGVISSNGNIIFTGLDPMAPADKNEKRVLRSHWRNRYIMPIGWGLLSLSFLLQFTATLSR
jgi:hypothetical protein